MEPGSVLTSPEPQEAAEAAQTQQPRSRGQSAEDEERSQSMRRKLEHLEMELRAAELVTSEVKMERSKPVQHPPVIRKRSSQKREAPPRPVMSVARKTSSETQASIDEEEEKENCIMCIRERSESLRPRMKTSSSEQRLGNKRPASSCQPSVTELSRIQRSKSDAGDLGVSNLGPVMRTNKNSANTISSKLIKRSMSFNRIFNSSMLSRSKEYRL